MISVLLHIGNGKYNTPLSPATWTALPSSAVAQAFATNNLQIKTSSAKGSDEVLELSFTDDSTADAGKL